MHVATMNVEHRPLVTDELVEFEKITGGYSKTSGK